MNIKLTVELFVMKMTTDSKFKKTLSYQFKIEIRSLTNIDLKTQKSQILNI